MDDKQLFRAEERMAFTVANPRSMAVLANIACGVDLTERSWPRWWCWLTGHQPTEADSFARNTRRCRCGTVSGVPGEVAHNAPFQWWLRLVGGKRRAWLHTIKAAR